MDNKTAGASVRCSFAAVLVSLLLVLSFACTDARCADLPVQLQGSVVDDFTGKYTAITKRIMLAGIELERFSLNYRLNSGKQPKFRRLRYFAAQETGAATGLAFEIVGVREFGNGRRHPLEVSRKRLHGGIAAVGIGTVIAGSGSCLELVSNAVTAVKNRRNGFDHGAATKFVVEKVRSFDQLLQERDQLVSSHSDHPAYARALAEGRVLRDLRDAFVDEYDHFHTDMVGYSTFQNMFFAMNIATTVVGATAARVAYRAVTKPRLNGPANILFTVSGAIATVSPLLSSTAAKVRRTYVSQQFAKKVGGKPHFDPAKLLADRQQLDALAADAQGTLVPSLPASQRLAIYGESQDRFQRQMDSETRVMRFFDKVALSSNVLGPAVGANLMTQGILGTKGYYDYTLKIRKQLDYYYRGSVAGTVGTGLSVVGTPAWLVTTYLYERHLRKQNRLPVQLIEARLAHLDDLQKEAEKL